MEFPEGTKFLDVDGVPVALLPNLSAVRPDGSEFPNWFKAADDGTPITREEFDALASS
jgi:hypothetical protein